MDFLYGKDNDPKVLVEQVKTLYRTLPSILAASLVVGGAMLFGLWDVVSQTALGIWFGLIVLVTLVRFMTYIRYRGGFNPAHVRQHALYLVLGSGAAGILWGGGSFLLFPEEGLEYQLFILFILVGMGAASVSSLTILLPAFFVYFPVSMLPVNIMLFWVGDPIHVALGMMMSAYIIALCYFGINISRSLTQSLKLRFENVDLVEQLREQKNEAEQANISKSRFLAAASHDLRQPLHALTLFTSVLDESIQYPKVRKVVDQINASVLALQSLFNALLDISRLEAGVMKVEKSSFDLRPLFEKLANDFNPQAREKGLRMEWPGSTYAVYTDQSLLEQILRNYVSNAIRYTNSGSILITCNEIKEQIHIQVADEGVGIPEEDQQAIFEEFHQLSNPERDRSKGLGLGLAIVQRSAKLLGHDIGVESALGKGSTFSFSVEPGQMAKELSTTNITPTSSDEPTDSALIIVIDDEVSVREGMQSLLQIWGCDVIAAYDLKDALNQTRQQTKVPDGIIADYRLRDKQTGIEAIQAIHAEYNKNIPALIVTGDIAVDRLREVTGSGFQVLHKPVAPVKLRTFLRNIQL